VGDGLRLEEVDEESPCEVCDEKYTEDAAFDMWASVPAIKNDPENCEEKDFVNLRRVTRYSVAKVDAPGKRGGFAVGVVGETGQEAPNATNGDAKAEWNGEEIAGAGADAGKKLHELHTAPATEQAADDRFAAASDYEELFPMEARSGQLLQNTQKATANQSSDRGRSYDRPAALVVEDVALPDTLAPVKRVAAHITKSFEKWMELGVEDLEQVVVSLSRQGR